MKYKPETVKINVKVNKEKLEIFKRKFPQKIQALFDMMLTEAIDDNKSDIYIKKTPKK